METTLAQSLAPGAAIIISAITLVVALRTQQSAAAKDTVDILETQNKVLSSGYDDLRTRVTDVEARLKICERERGHLMNELKELRAQLNKR